MTNFPLRALFASALVLLCGAFAYTAITKGVGTSDTAGWAQAIGGIGSVWAAILIGQSQVKAARLVADAEAKERRQAQEDITIGATLSTIIKVWRIANVLHTLRTQFGPDLPRRPDGSIAIRHPWLVVRGNGGLTPQHETFTPSELASIMALKIGETFSVMMLLDERLDASINTILHYNSARSKLQSHLPPPEDMEDVSGTVTIPAELLKTLLPMMEELNDLISSVTSSLASDEEDAKQLLLSLAKAAKARYPHRNWPDFREKGAAPSPEPPLNVQR